MKQKKSKIVTRERILALTAFFVLIAFVWGAFTYLERFALGATVEKQIKYIEEKTNKMEKLYDLKFLTHELKTVEDQIFQFEKNFGTTPKNPEKRAELERLRRERERIIMEIKALQKK